MSEPLFQLCPLCHGTKRLPEGAQVCDYPAHLNGACLCTLGRHPGFAETGLTMSQVERWMPKATAARRMVLELDGDDYRAIQAAIAKRQLSRDGHGAIMPDGDSNTAGAYLAEICRGWWEMVQPPA